MPLLKITALIATIAFGYKVYEHPEPIELKLRSKY